MGGSNNEVYTIRSSWLEPTFIIEHWPLTGVSIGPILPSYPERLVLRIFSDQGSFVAKVCPVRTGQNEFSPSLLEYLNEKGFEHAPSLLRTRHGEPSVAQGEEHIWIMEYIPHEISRASQDGSRDWYELGKAAGALNQFHDCPYPYGVPTEAALEEISRGMERRPFHHEFLAIQSRLWTLIDVNRVGLIHAEINEANARVRSDGTVVLVDWDQAGSGRTVLEPGYPLITTFLSEENLVFDGVTAKDFYQGYCDAGGHLERRIVFTAALFHACRYIHFGNTEKRWRRIQHALRSEEELCSVIPDCTTKT